MANPTRRRLSDTCYRPKELPFPALYLLKKWVPTKLTTGTPKEVIKAQIKEWQSDSFALKVNVTPISREEAMTYLI